MKKIIPFLLFAIILTGCQDASNTPIGKEITIEEAYEQLGKLYNKNKEEIKTFPSFDSVYMKEERKQIKYDDKEDKNEESFITKIISYSKENYYFHYEWYSENKTSSLFLTELKDMYIKDEKLHFFRTYLINNRISYKKYYICDLDYLWTDESDYSGHLEEVLGEEYVKSCDFNLAKANYIQYLENNYLFKVEGTNSFLPSLECFKNRLNEAETLKMYFDQPSNTLTFDKTYKVTSDVKNYNLRVNASVKYVNEYLSKTRDDYYNGNYSEVTYLINNKISLPKFNFNDYEETEPDMIDVDYVSFHHVLN